MSTVTINEDGLIPKDPADVKVYTFDWDAENLAAAATIVSSLWTIAAIKPSKTDAALTKDQESILSGSRKTALRLTGGTLGQVYEVTNTIVTSETPAQTKERSVRVLVQD